MYVFICKLKGDKNMAFIVKETFHKAGADVLLEVNLGPIEKCYQVLADPRVLSQVLYRSSDRSYGEVYRTWESAESHHTWENDTAQLQQEIRDEMFPYYDMVGITFKKYVPTEPDQEWNIDPDLIQIEFEQVFE
jgi:hypothetical protein